MTPTLLDTREIVFNFRELISMNIRLQNDIDRVDGKQSFTLTETAERKTVLERTGDQYELCLMEGANNAFKLVIQDFASFRRLVNDLVELWKVYDRRLWVDVYRGRVTVPSFTQKLQ